MQGDGQRKRARRIDQRIEGGSGHVQVGHAEGNVSVTINGENKSNPQPGCFSRVTLALLALGIFGSGVATLISLASANMEAADSGNPGFSDADYSTTVGFAVLMGVLIVVAVVFAAASNGGRGGQG